MTHVLNLSARGLDRVFNSSAPSLKTSAAIVFQPVCCSPPRRSCLARSLALAIFVGD